MLFSTACAIHQVRVLPCPDANRHKPCKLKRGRTFAIEFDYTPGNLSMLRFAEYIHTSPTKHSVISILCLSPIASIFTIPVQCCLFDHSADFDANTAISEVYWASPEGDIPFAGMNRAACEHTTCPLQRTTKNLYTYSLLIDKKYPAVGWKKKCENLLHPLLSTCHRAHRTNVISLFNSKHSTLNGSSAMAIPTNKPKSNAARFSQSKLWNEQTRICSIKIQQQQQSTKSLFSNEK